MRFRKIAAAVLACMAVAAVSASGAQAQWTIGEAGNALAANAHQGVAISKHPGTTLALTGSILGTSVWLTAENVQCASGKTCTIDGEEFGTNHSTGTLEFTGVTVDIGGVPSSVCSVSSEGTSAGTIKTKPLTDEVVMHTPGGPDTEKPVFDRFFPQTGETFVTIIIEGEECPLNEIEAEVTGEVAGEAVKTNGSGEFVRLATGELTSPQTLLFSQAGQETYEAGLKGRKGLKLGNAAAYLDGAVDNTLTGANAGKAFGADT